MGYRTTFTGLRTSSYCSDGLCFCFYRVFEDDNEKEIESVSI